MDKMCKSPEEWRAQLTAEQYRVTREKATEHAFTGEYVDCQDEGTYHCVCCGRALFDSRDKYASGCGWPSFSQPINSAALDTEADYSAGMARTEIRCRRCDAHLGHVFDDGPAPTGQRHCVNSVALKLRRR